MASGPDHDLGTLVAVYPIAPAYMQRALFITVLSFVFFLGNMLVFYINQSVSSFLLASAFLAVYLVTLFSWVMQRRSHVEVFENGFRYKKRTAVWNEVEGIDGGTINISGGKPVVLPKTLHDRETLLTFIRQKAGGRETTVA